MRAIDRAVAHYEALGTQSLEVPEWGDESGPFAVHWTPLTVADMTKAAAAPRDEQSIFEMYVDLIVDKARDADGAPLFTVKDKFDLRHRTARHVVFDIGNAMTARARVTKEAVEQAEKN